MVHDELREICLPILWRTMKLAIGKFIAISLYIYINMTSHTYCFHADEIGRKNMRQA